MSDTTGQPSKKATPKRSISTQRLIKENKRKIKELGLDSANIYVNDYIGLLGDALVDELTS